MRVGLMVIASVGLAGVAYAQAPQEEPKLGWSNSTELSWVATAGNSRVSTVGFRNVYRYRWTGAELLWESGWVRAASQDGARYAVSTGDGGFEIVEPDTAVDSERLYSKLRYQRQITARHDWFANMDAARDEPSNVLSQFVFAGGLGTTWHKSDRFTFRTSYGVSFTDEDLELEGERQFGGYRLFYRAEGAPTANTKIESELTADGSFGTAEDIRSDWLNSVAVAINSRVALKTSLRLIYRNLPALEAVDLQVPGLGVVIGTVEIPKEKLDTSFTTSLVITF